RGGTARCDGYAYERDADRYAGPHFRQFLLPIAIFPPASDPAPESVFRLAFEHLGPCVLEQLLCAGRKRSTGYRSHAEYLRVEGRSDDGAVGMERRYSRRFGRVELCVRASRQSTSSCAGPGRLR